MGVLLGLIGGPAGLLAWTLGDALVGGVAGKRLGQPFDADQLKAFAVDMAPNTSGILVVIEDKLAQDAAKAMGEYGAKVVTLTLGDQLSGEVASFGAIELGADAEEAADTDTPEKADVDAPEKVDQPTA